MVCGSNVNLLSPSCLRSTPLLEELGLCMVQWSGPVRKLPFTCQKWDIDWLMLILNLRWWELAETCHRVPQVRIWWTARAACCQRGRESASSSHQPDNRCLKTRRTGGRIHQSHWSVPAWLYVCCVSIWSHGIITDMCFVTLYETGDKNCVLPVKGGGSLLSEAGRSHRLRIVEVTIEKWRKQ